MGQTRLRSKSGLARHAGAAWYGEARSTWDAWTERVLGTDDPLGVERMMATALPLFTANPERPRRGRGPGHDGPLPNDGPGRQPRPGRGDLSQTINVRPTLAKVAGPTLVIAGELDCLCGPGTGTAHLGGDFGR